MSYQVLARKWRPGNFDELVGQAHVLRALTSALENERLHHAYLFTGTRGVGKTTIARIFAKCLNCEKGITARPCGNCSACNEINEGRFVDLIEVDAASRTKVEQTRELMENVQYRPTRGRYKVYLIDEVHMLSTHSFNALLKTLEEPPPHVVFLLATTEPQKLLPTVLSRCLQFHLKNMQPDDISDHLGHILDAETIKYEQPALDSLSWSARGSMRDALSLLDQAIAYGNGKVTDYDVREMLGSIDRDHIYRIISALAINDGSACMAVIDEISQFAPDYDELLAELLVVLHRVALIQQIPDATIATQEREPIKRLAESIAAEDIQLFYQLALHGRRDLPLAPDSRSGFEMCMLRLMNFQPSSTVAKPHSTGVSPVKKSEGSLPETVKTVDVSSQSIEQQKELEVLQSEPELTDRDTVDFDVQKVDINKSQISSSPIKSPLVRNQNRQTKTVVAELESIQDQGKHDQGTGSIAPNPSIKAIDTDLPAVEEVSYMNWHTVVEKAVITGVTEQMALHSQFISFDGESLILSLDHHVRSMVNPEHLNKLTAAFNSLYNVSFTITITEAEPEYETPNQRRVRIRNELHQTACDDLNNDTQVQALIKTFDAKLDSDTVETVKQNNINILKED